MVPHPVQPLRDEHGQVLHWYATGTDIDDCKRAERACATKMSLREEIDPLPMFEEIVRLSAPLRRRARPVWHG